MTERIRIAAPQGSYDVVVGTDLLPSAGEHLPDLPGAERCFVVTDQRLAGLHLAALALPLPSVSLHVPEGEEAKTLTTVEALYQQLTIQEAHRDDPIVALGGGSVGDVAGFVAATYMRGVPFVQVPTTLTAQVDAAIGGKVGVNLPRGKNLVGAFHHPVAVVADVGTLATLEDRQFRSGLAEAAKYALALVPELIEILERNVSGILARDPEVLGDIVIRCVRAKAEVVAEDERDRGHRAVLNYGHTIGHALERLDRFAGLTHGEAVAIGMVAAARLSERLGIAEPGLARRHQRLLAALGLPHESMPRDADAVLEAMRMDKKYRGGVRMVLLEDVGRPRIADAVDEVAVREILS